MQNSEKSRYDYSHYIRSELSTNISRDGQLITTQPGKVFEFVQKCQHPQMFLEISDDDCDDDNNDCGGGGGGGGGGDTGDPIEQSKRRKRISYQPSTRLSSFSFSGHTDEWKPQKLSNSSHSEKPRKLSSQRSISLPDINAFARKKMKSLLKRTSFEAPDDAIFYIPHLPIFEETTESSEFPPIIQFSLFYDIQCFTLRIHLQNASNLPAKDRRGTSDPFVVLYLMPNKEEIFESKIVYKSLNPVFDQSFEFKSLMPDDIQEQTLVLRIYDHDKYSKNDTIGGVVLPLKDVDLFGVIMKMKVESNKDFFNKVR